MQIRAKRTTLLLCFALIPVMLIFILHANSMRKTRHHITGETRKLLESNAKHHLQTVVNDFGKIVQRDRIAAEQSLTIMAKQIEDTLASKKPPNVKPYFSKDYENSKTAPADLAPSQYYHKTINGKERNIPVSFSNVVFFRVKGTPPDSIIGDVNKLTPIGKACEEIRKTHAAGMTWLYAGFEKGFFMSYPGHGGYPENYDPRKRIWYQKAKTKRTLVWTLLPDVSTRKVALTVSRPVHYPNGKFAGVAAIDTGLTQMLDIVNLPPAWKASAVILQVAPKAPDQEEAPKTGIGIGDRLLIVAQESYVAQGEDWEKGISHFTRQAAARRGEGGHSGGAFGNTQDEAERSGHYLGVW